GSSELINDLSRLGADAIKRGHKSFKAFAVEMKAVLGDAWAKVKHLMQRAYAGSKKILAGEKGTWTIKGEPLARKALKAIGVEPKLKEGEPLPKRARSIGLESPTGKKVYLDVSKEAKELATELGLSYPKEVVTHKEIELEADRIMKSDEQLQEVLSKARKEQKLSNPEMLVVRRTNATALETFTDILKTGKSEEINKKLQIYKEGIFKTTQDLHRQRGQDLNALKIQVQATPDAISNAFAGLKRDLRPQDTDLYNAACEAMKLGNDKPMVSFMKYLKKTEADPALMDYVYEYWYNCILSGVPTHVINVASNTTWAAWQVGVHRPLLAAIDPIVAKFQKRPTEYYLDEIVPMLAGIRKGYKPGAEAAKEIMTKGYTTEASLDKWALDMGKTIGAFARSPNKHLRQIAPFLTIPTKALRAMDVWANQMGYQAELGAICKRMEKQGKGKFED
ncbi:hypothetical protein KA005_20905, partial [bacterium]|nr:hypothetical protein [bacterium]